jgi:hypothetical protein
LSKIYNNIVFQETHAAGADSIVIDLKTRQNIQTSQQLTEPSPIEVTHATTDQTRMKKMSGKRSASLLSGSRQLFLLISSEK